MHTADTEIQTAETNIPETDCYGRLLAPVADWHDSRVICSHTLPGTPTRPAHRCGSPALRGEPFCYYHHPTRAIVHNPHERRARRIARQAYTIPAPTCRADVQRSIGELARRIAANQIDLKRAALLLNALQTVAQDLPERALPEYDRPLPMRWSLQKGGSDWS
jgi:hypothetical protein